MKATDVLMTEHRVIEQVLTCLEVIADRAERSGELDSESARQALDFFRAFADRCHHGKEEGHLFPLLEARGMRRDSGPTGVMLHEHELGRKLLALMSAANDLHSGADFLPPARSYIRLLRDHIWKEDQCLFPMAGQLLSTTDDEQLMDSFESDERTEMGEGMHENYLRLADQLADRFGVTRTAPVTSGCSHHHHGRNPQAGQGVE
jgi:hemerythrin-like domain-containing protein